MMRGMKAATLATMLIGVSAVVADENDKPPARKIAKAISEITIDGVLDEPAWKAATPVDVVYVWGKTGQASDKPWMISRFTWDDHYLYIGYKTFDKNVVAIGTGKQDGPKDNQREGAELGHPTEKPDLVEFFISFGDEHFFWEIHQNAKNQFNDVWCSVMDEKEPIVKTTRARFGIQFGFNDFVEDDVDAGCTLQTAVKLKPKADGRPSTLNDASDEDTGYVGEMRLPWFGLGGPTAAETMETVKSADANVPARNVHGPWKMAGQELMILSVCQNGDREEIYNHSSPTFPGGWYHKGAAHYPRYLLEGSPK